VLVLAAQRQVDVARVALALVELRHERDRVALLGRELLGAVLVDRVRVGGRQRVLVGEVDLVLAEVALALGVLDREPAAAISRRIRPSSGSSREVPRIE
jgi:hypothetical protein